MNRLVLLLLFIATLARCQRDEQPIISNHAPVLQVSSTEGFLPETAEIGTTVRISPSMQSESLQILVNDEDLQPGMPPATYQYILTGLGATIFAVDQRGFVYLNVPNIDADPPNPSTYQLNVEAREVNTTPNRRSDPVTITIHILDANDNSPQFEQPIYMANVSAFGDERLVAKIQATDVDSGIYGRIRYSISQVTNGAEDNFRYVESTNSLIALGDLQPGERYQVVIDATDGGGRSSQAIVIVLATDVNVGIASLAPLPGMETFLPNPAYSTTPMTTSAESEETIQTFVTEVSENTPPNTVVVSLGGDESREITYFNIVGGNEDGKFAIDELGTITTLGELDREKTAMYSLQVETRSRSPDQHLYWTLVQITVVDVNDNAPVFVGDQPIRLRLSIDDIDKLTPDMVIGRVEVEDPDSDDDGRVQLRILPPYNKLFTISNDGIVSVNGDFTAAHFGEHDIVINARDHGDPAKEATAHVQVSIFGTMITVATAAPTNEVFEYTSSAETDATSPDDYLQSITPNPMKPQVFSKFPQPTPVEQPPTVLTTTAEPYRPAELPTLIPAPAPDVTEPETSESTELEIQSTTPISAETSASQEVSIESETSTHYTTDYSQEFHQTSTMSVDDVDPESESETDSYHGGWTAPTTLTPDADITVESEEITSTTDPDATWKSVEVTSTEASWKSEEVKSTETPWKSEEVTSTFNPDASWKSVETTSPDGPEATWKSEETTSASAPESTWKSGEVTSTSDPEATWKSEEVTSTSDPGANWKSGETTVESEMTTSTNQEPSQETMTSRETMRSWPTEPVTMVSSEEASTTTRLESSEVTTPMAIKETKRRLAPVFKPAQLTVSVDENESEIEITKVHATYPDGKNGPVTYVLHKGDPSIFSVSSFSGSVMLLRKLDAEMNATLNVQISTAEASELELDSKLAHFVNINVNVADTNDWIPNFEMSSYNFDVQEDTIPGTIVGQVSAFDQDRDEPNNKIRYRLVSAGGLEANFNVNQENGLITLARPVEAFAGEKITLRIEASDSGSPPQSSFTNVLIDVIATSSQVIPDSSPFDNRPQDGQLQFSLRNYTASVSEAVRPPHLVQILSVNNKPEDTRFIICSIVSGNYRGAFGVTAGNDGNCELRTQMELDRESVERYLLNITVTAGSQTDFALVSITVLDVNDNVPKFVYDSDLGLTSYFGGISSGANAFTRVLTVKAEDADLGNSSYVSYSLDPLSPHSKFFSISPFGEISTKQSMSTVLQKNRLQYFDVRVSACDSPISGQQLCSKADVTINVVTPSNRFKMITFGLNPQQLRSHEKDMIKSIRQFAGSCNLLNIEKMVEHTAIEGQARTDIYWYAVNPSTKKICKKHEFKKMFETSSVQMIAGKVQPWFRLERIVEEVGDEAGLQNNGFLPSNWKTASILLIILAVVIALGALVGICAVCIFWSRYKISQRNINTFTTHNYAQKMGTVYLPNMPMDPRMEKIYETQMLEMPISDEDLTMKSGSIGASQPRNVSYRNYGRHHNGAYEGDFSIEESMYAINVPGRIDPVTKRIQALIIPQPDYHARGVPGTHHKSIL